jgi:hypothetical protein
MNNLSFFFILHYLIISKYIRNILLFVDKNALDRKFNLLYSNYLKSLSSFNLHLKLCKQLSM